MKSLLVLLGWLASGQEPSRPRLDRATVRVGETVEWRVSLPEGRLEELRFETPLEASGLHQVGRRVESVRHGTDLVLRLVAEAPGPCRIPAARIALAGERGTAARAIESALLDVRSRGTEGLPQMAPLVELPPIARVWSDLRWAAASLAVGALLGALLRMLRRQRAPLLHEQPARWALRQLARITVAESASLEERIEAQARVSQVLRSYLDAAWSVPALRQTREETARSLAEGPGALRDRREALLALLAASDRPKYSHRAHSRAEVRDQVSQAATWIQELCSRAPEDRR